MPFDRSRRSFLGTAAGTFAGSLAVTGSWADLRFLSALPPVSAAEAKPIAGVSIEIEPLVRLIEETPRDRLLEEVAARIRRGTSYREVVAALLLAGVRNIQPRPNVGFKFHAVLVVNSAHLASLASPDEHRWLPIFWALDYFKDAQAQNVREGNWHLPPVEESRIPPSHQAAAMLVDALERWDESQADVAVASMARSAGAGELFEILCRYGARDYRSIGHKAIFVANAWRTLHCVGWEHAEPVLRSLAYAILNHTGEGNPAENDYAADRPYRENLQRIQRLPVDWNHGKLDAKATEELLRTFYAGSSSDVCDQLCEMLGRGVATQSIWDAVLLQGGELLVRQPGIVGLHTLTTANALRYAYGAASGTANRQLLLLQAAAFLPMFRASMQGRGEVAATRILEVEPISDSNTNDELTAESLKQIFVDIDQDRMQAARRTLAYAQGHADPAAFMTHARLLVFMKGRDSHDYKFSSAVLEDFHHLSPAWRPRFLAASVFQLRGSGAADNPLVQRSRSLFGG